MIENGVNPEALAVRFFFFFVPWKKNLQRLWDELLQFFVKRYGWGLMVGKKGSDSRIEEGEGAYARTGG